MDVFTKLTRLYPVAKSAINDCCNAINQFMSKYGKVKTILTDRALTFTSPKWKQYWNEKGVRIRLTSVYTPQSNPLETRMKVIGDCLRIYCPSEHHKWDEHLLKIERRLNKTEHVVTGTAPVTLFLKKTFETSAANCNVSNIIKQLDLERSIRNLFHCRDGQSEYTMYFTSELPILYGEFVDRNRNVMVDCNDEVLSGRVQTIKESELKPTSEIVKLEEDVVEEAILALNNKREELISYKARCGRFCDRIDNCIAEVNVRRAAQEAAARVQEIAMDLSRGNCKLNPVVEPPIVMAEEQQLGIEVQQNEEVEAELQQEIVMDVEEYSIHDGNTTESESGKGVNLINLVTIIDPEIVESRKRKNKNIPSLRVS
ncbi:hypothetical protein V9T40_011977 [Parthenolecanium corni]|uniref:Integrase catalytic domain-containing protein n=1 Tax=Parthenolecanium corni TaxID=536013 RepID=A0AAN9TM98_9HEMI